jgi:hypothetical protein
MLGGLKGALATLAGCAALDPACASRGALFVGDGDGALRWGLELRSSSFAVFAVRPQDDSSACLGPLSRSPRKWATYSAPKV